MRAIEVERDSDEEARLAACYVACRDVPTSALSPGLLVEMQWALQQFVHYYDQAGIGPVPDEESEDDPDYGEAYPGFDGDERFNVRHARSLLARLKEPTP
jgi:hypothetical protein